MEKVHVLRVMLFCTFVLFGLVNAPVQASKNLEYLNFYREDERSLVDSMSLEEKVGQILIFGFQGYALDEDHRGWIQSGRLGNVKLFLRNIESVEQVRELTGAVEGLACCSPSGIPPFIATDLEGGVVNHLRIKELFNPPAAGLIGANGDPGYGASVSRFIALTLHDLGINMNFAPCVDILTNLDNQVIGTRSYGSDPEAVYEMARVFLEEQKKLGIVSAVKHFPGHGMTDFDSHVFSLGVNVSREEMERVHLSPYRKLIQDGLVDCCMGTHVIYNSLDPFYPATFSSRIMDQLLREELGFRGIAVTDDLEMEGSASYASDIVKAFIMAFRGGNDLILISHTKERQEKILEAAVQLFERGVLGMSELEEKVLRVLRVKKRYLTRFYVRRGSEDLRQLRRSSAVESIKEEMDGGIVCLASRVDRPLPEYMKEVAERRLRGLILAPTWLFAWLAEKHLPGWDVVHIEYFPHPRKNAKLLRETAERLSSYEMVLLGMGTVRQLPWARVCAAQGVPFVLLSINNPGLALPFASRALFVATSFEPYPPAIEELFESVFMTGSFSHRLPYR